MRESKTKAQRPVVARLQVNPGGYAFAARHDGSQLAAIDSLITTEMRGQPATGNE